MGKETIEKMKDGDELEEEFEMLLNEIPQATSQNLLHIYHRNQRAHGGVGGDDDDVDDHGSFVTKGIHGMYAMYDDDPLTRIQYPCASSPVSGFSLQSDGSSSSLFSIGHALSDTGSPTPSPLEDLKSTKPSGSFSHQNRFWFDSMTHDSSTVMKKNANESLVDELGLSANLSQMHITSQQENPYNFKNDAMGMNMPPFHDHSLSANGSINVPKHGNCNNFKRGFLDSVGFQPPLSRNPINQDAQMNSALSGLTQDYRMTKLFGSREYVKRPERIVPQINGFRGSMDSPMHRRQLINNYYYRGSQAPEPTGIWSRSQVIDALLYAEKSRMNLMEESGMSRLPSSSSCIDANLRPYLSAQNLLQNRHSHLLSNNARVMPPSNARIPQGNLDAITSEGSFILQGEGLNYVAKRGLNRSKCQSEAAVQETGFVKHRQRSELDMQFHVGGNFDNPRNGGSFPPLPKFNSLAEARGYIYLMAKDQHGCRFLQRMFDEGTPEDVQMIFDEIIGHVVELMMNSFGNYLMQKLLDVCNEEQRMHILLIITQEPGQLVRISLNSHGTRVVQKLIETLQTRQQILLVVSALEPGFLALIKDLNGNHVVQRCLLCLSNEDNKFIFAAAAKYCVDIATHQHGCCVLQRCIGHSSGEHREKLIAEISANALQLAQDQYGNYVVQFILDLRIPSATTSIRLQFEGNYVQLSRSKFGSHVVEKCLSVFIGENQSKVIYELLSAPHFGHLLQDPHANYVVQSALKHSEGRLHNLLVEAIESHKAAFSRNCPYSKNIFSPKLLKK